MRFQEVLKYHLTELSNMVEAKLCFLRTLSTYQGNQVLFLVGMFPWNSFEESFHSDIVAHRLDEDKQENSILARAFYTRERQMLNCTNDLRENLVRFNVIEPINPRSCFVIPLPNQHAMLSFYWDRPITPLPPSSEKIIQRLSTYLSREDEQIQDWIRKKTRRSLSLTDDWEFSGKITRDLIKETDLSKSCDILAQRIVPLSGAKGACILIYDEDTKVFKNQFGHGIGGDCPPPLLAMSHTLSEIKKFMTQAIVDQDDKSFYMPYSDQLPDDKLMAFPLRVADDNEPTGWKWIGVLLLLFPKQDYPTHLKRRQLELLAGKGATDFRNCQLIFKNNTTAKAQDTLINVTTMLFSAERVTERTRDFFKIIADILNTTFEHLHSCTFGVIDGDSLRINQSLWHTTVTDDWSRMGIHSPERKNELRMMVNQSGQVIEFDYRPDANEYDKFFLEQGVTQCYSIAFSVEDGKSVIIYTNYHTINPGVAYETRKILEVLPGPIAQAWAMWQRWRKLLKDEKARQRLFWQYEIHDQLNELQNNVIRPLELHAMHLNMDGHDAYVKTVEKIHHAARGVNTTIRLLNDDLRDPVYMEYGLIAAFYYFALKKERYPSLSVSCHGDEPNDTEVTGALYLIAREAINNAYKHGAVGKIEVTLQLICSPDRVELTVEDNGAGYGGEERPGSGVSLMRYQAELIGAEIAWNCHEPGTGTRLQIVWKNDSTIKKTNYIGHSHKIMHPSFE